MKNKIILLVLLLVIVSNVKALNNNQKKVRTLFEENTKIYMKTFGGSFMEAKTIQKADRSVKKFFKSKIQINKKFDKLLDEANKSDVCEIVQMSTLQSEDTEEITTYAELFGIIINHYSSISPTVFMKLIKENTQKLKKKATKWNKLISKHSLVPKLPNGYCD